LVDGRADGPGGEAGEGDEEEIGPEGGFVEEIGLEGGDIQRLVSGVSGANAGMSDPVTPPALKE